MNILRKTKDILRYVFTRMWNRQFLVFLFFLALSTSFWLFQALDETYEEDFSLPVELRNIPRDVVIASDVPKAVQIVLRDKGTTLLNYMYGDKLKASLIKGAGENVFTAVSRTASENTSKNTKYPNPVTGWGTLCLLDSIP